MDFVAQAEKIGNVVGLWVFIVFAIAILFGFKRLGGQARFKHGETELEFTPDGKEPREQKTSETFERPSLVHHRVFHVLRNALSPGFVMQAPQGEYTAKWAINEAFIKDCKVRVFYDGLIDFFTELEKRDGSGLSKLPDAISDLIEDYERASRRVQIELPGGNVIIGVPCCYQKKFNNWHTPHVKLCLSGITETLSSRFYPDWWTRATVCLEYIAMAFDLTFEDAERTLSQLNGDLDREIASILNGMGEGGVKENVCNGSVS